MPLLLALAAIVADSSSPRVLTVVNDTGSAVNQLFVNARRTRGWRAKVAGIVGPAEAERDRLEARMLSRPGSVEVALTGAQCRYDLRAVLEDGQTFTAVDFDVCAATRWAIGRGTRQ